PWDSAAGVVLVEEGGGRVSGLPDGADPVFSGGIVASNGRLHAAMMEAAAPLGAAYAAVGGRLGLLGSGCRLSAYRLWGAGLSAAEGGRHAAESPLNPPAAPADTRDTWRAAALPESQGTGALPVSAGPHSLTPWPHDRARSAPARQPRRRPPPPHRPRRRRLPGEPPPPLLLPP